MAAPKIHSTALVATGARLGADVQIGPYAVIEDDVEIGSGSVIGPHAVIHVHTRIGARNRIHGHVILGDRPQHLAYKPEDVTWLEIGDDNIFREMVTVHRAFHAGAVTRIGSGCFLMAGSHVGHDSELGNNVILTNSVLVGGHVTIGDRAVLGGGSSVHQFTRIGPYVMLGAHTLLRKDALPYSMISGDPAKHYRLNSVGLRRNGIGGDRYKALEQAFRRLRAGEDLEGIAQTDETRYLLEWMGQPSKRGLTGFKRASVADSDE
ncbi:MAG TPA: acyl-ACP--UDP-N-acetylglucosamine O-acyltransferase [Gammaproteobacteria bacterium]|nr:acyl-ACP--UDP-N-acetylglucosamine O-acyltransferase [Gammaproteobacteria bacterium]